MVKVSTAAREVLVVSWAKAVRILNAATVVSPPIRMAGQAARCGHNGRRLNSASPSSSSTPAPKPRPRALNGVSTDNMIFTAGQFRPQAMASSGGISAGRIGRWRGVHRS